VLLLTDRKDEPLPLGVAPSRRLALCGLRLQQPSGARRLSQAFIEDTFDLKPSRISQAASRLVRRVG
jgi:hypothetical protein